MRLWKEFVPIYLVYMLSEVAEMMNRIATKRAPNPFQISKTSERKRQKHASQKWKPNTKLGVIRVADAIFWKNISKQMLNLHTS
jgi:hypothetical protein